MLMLYNIKTVAGQNWEVVKAPRVCIGTFEPTPCRQWGRIEASMLEVLALKAHYMLFRFLRLTQPPQLSGDCRLRTMSKKDR